jgi:hypothetical protein
MVYLTVEEPLVNQEWYAQYCRFGPPQEVPKAPSEEYEVLGMTTS